MPGHLLIVDDDPDTCALLEAGLANAGHQIETRNSAEEALAALETLSVDVVLTDIHMSGMLGTELCARIREIHPNLPVIVMTGQASMESAVAALRAGAHDFVTKPVSLQQLLHRVSKAIRHRELEREVRRLQRALDEDDGRSVMIGESPAIARIRSLTRRVAESDVPVLVSGESGVGKELVARELHRLGADEGEPFVAINCAAVPTALLESELFGHVRGAFTDARRSREGLFLRAQGGTLFLDEIGEMPLDMQPKLLRALQERRVRPVGGDATVPFSARIVTATNRDLEAEVEEGRFREDLFYRINVVNVHVPPLRARGADILLLAQYFLSRIAERTGKPVHGLAPDVADKIMNYDWPGNVRELENCMERAMALARYDEITSADLPDKISRYTPDEMVIGADDPEDMPTLAALEARYIRRVMHAVKDNKTQAAKILGLARRTLYRKLERLDGPDAEKDDDSEGAND